MLNLHEPPANRHAPCPGVRLDVRTMRGRRPAARPNTQGHRVGASDLAIFERPDRPLQYTALFPLFVGSHGATEPQRDSSIAADDSRNAILQQGFAEGLASAPVSFRVGGARRGFAC